MRSWTVKLPWSVTKLGCLGLVVGACLISQVLSGAGTHIQILGQRSCGWLPESCFLLLHAKTRLVEFGKNLEWESCGWFGWCSCVVFACHFERLNGIPEKIWTLGQLPTGLITSQERERERRIWCCDGKDFSSILITVSLHECRHKQHNLANRYMTLHTGWPYSCAS